MRVAVVGSVNYDTIITPRRERRESLGGVLYNVVVLSSLLNEDSQVSLITRIGREHYSKLLELFEARRTIDLSGVRISPRGTNENRLVYVSERERIEKLTMKAGSLKYEDIRTYLGADLILFNFITGLEISLSLLQETRRNSDAVIYVDVHSKVLGMREDGSRYPFGWPDWEEWLQHADIVQMSLEECRLLLNERVKSPEALFAAAKRIAAVGPTQVLITLGEGGALVYWRDGGEQCESIPASTYEVVDTTGCGDCFTAGYIWGLFKYKEPVKAACIANVVAGENCRALGLIGEVSPSVIEAAALSLYPDVFHR